MLQVKLMFPPPEDRVGVFTTWGYPLLLSSLAGLSTTIGGIIAVVSKPSDARLAFLLGLALGVMCTVSFVELFLHNAMTHNAYLVTASVISGATLYYLISPLLPKKDDHDGCEEDLEQNFLLDGEKRTADGAADISDVAVGKGSGFKISPQPPAARAPPPAPWPSTLLSSSNTPEPQSHEKPPANKKALLRLGLLMAVTMTLHNLPEGLAVGFSAFTKAGPMMALAIAVHNIPEGIIIAAPIYAATNSRSRALLLSALSGMSEPLGALIALLVLSPFMGAVGLHYWLGGTGGVMLAVCALELWPEGRRCGHDIRLLQGIAAGVVLMGWTLYIGV